MIKIITLNLLLISFGFTAQVLEDVVFVSSEKPFFIQVFENSNQKGADQGVIGLWSDYPWKPARFSYEEADVYCNKIGMRLPTEDEWYEAASNLGENSTYTLRGDKLYDENNELLAYIDGPQSIDTYDIDTLGIDSIGTVAMTGNRPEYVISSDPADPVYCGGAYETTDIEKVKLANACKRLSLGDTRSGTARCVLDYDESLEYEITYSEHVKGELKDYLQSFSGNFPPHGVIDPYDTNPETAVLIPDNKWSKADDDDPTLLDFLEADEWLDSLMEGYNGPVVEPIPAPPATNTIITKAVITESLRLMHQFSPAKQHSCAIHNNSVVCWGNNDEGQLDVPTLKNPKMVVAGHCFSCAVDDQGLKCWGNTGILKGLPSNLKPISITAGDHHLCALDKNGIDCWMGSSKKMDIPPLSNPSLVSARRDHTCAYDNNGITCWGTDSINDYPIGIKNSTIPPLSSPRMLSTGDDHLCVLDDLGVRCWGDDDYDQVNNIPELLNSKMIATGQHHSCVLDDRGVHCWGDESNHQIDVPTLYEPIAVFAAENRSCALDNEGLKCWGDDDNGLHEVPGVIKF